MTLRAILGLAVLNLAFAVVGGSLLWGLRGWRWWTEAVRLAGLAYLLGIAAMVIALTFELVVGIPFGATTILVTGVLLAGIGIGLGVYRNRVRPGWAAPGWHLPEPSILVALMIASVVLWLEASFRAARLQPLWNFDAWWVWTSRAKALFFEGDLGGTSALRGGTTDLLSYPPGLSLLQAQAFEAMDAADTITLHLQNWFLVLGFLAAVFGLLAGRVRAAILVPVVLLTIVMPNFADIAIWPIADPFLAYLISVGALLLYLWLEDRSTWHVPTAVLLLGASVLVKREAVLPVLCVLLAAVAASWSTRRESWPTLGIAALVVYAVSAPWRVWVHVNGGSEAPTGGYLSLVEAPARGLDSAELVISTFFGARWGLPMVLAVGAALLAIAARQITGPTFALTFAGASFAATTFVIWAEPFFAISQNLSQNPVVRMVMGIVVVACPITALMLEDAWRATQGSWADQSRTAMRPRRAQARAVVAWGIILAAVAVYPASAVLRIPGPTFPGGRPSFPGTEHAGLAASLRDRIPPEPTCVSSGRRCVGSTCCGSTLRTLLDQRPRATSRPTI